MNKVDLSSYDNSGYQSGAGIVKRMLWFYCNTIFLNSSLLPVNAVKIFLLRLFGAKIGVGVTIKPCVNIKYPWFLQVGNNVWIGENVWIDNLTNVEIGDNCCLSQGAMLLTGNHDFTQTTFDLIVKPIRLEDGVWIGAKAIVCPGIVCFSHSVLAVNSVATQNMEAYKIYQGNPAKIVKERTIQS
ncbi:MAG: WcaF family extracellular polysaccharide biosynthesis acetyltransferase [Cytophagales bacterium]